MAKTAKITLGETEYTIKAMTVGQVERIGDQLDVKTGTTGTSLRQTINLLAIVVEGSEPPINDIRSMAGVTPTQMQEALQAGLRLAGMQTPENPPEAAVH